MIPTLNDISHVTSDLRDMFADKQKISTNEKILKRLGVANVKIDFCTKQEKTSLGETLPRSD